MCNYSLLCFDGVGHFCVNSCFYLISNRKWKQSHQRDICANFCEGRVDCIELCFHIEQMVVQISYTSCLGAFSR